MSQFYGLPLTLTAAARRPGCRPSGPSRASTPSTTCPKGLLTSCSGEAETLPAGVLQGFLDDVAAGRRAPVADGVLVRSPGWSRPRRAANRSGRAPAGRPLPASGRT